MLSNIPLCVAVGKTWERPGVHTHGGERRKYRHAEKRKCESSFQYKWSLRKHNSITYQDRRTDQIFPSEKENSNSILLPLWLYLHNLCDLQHTEAVWNASQFLYNHHFQTSGASSLKSLFNYAFIFPCRQHVSALKNLF